jgi:hypothetical protein
MTAAGRIEALSAALARRRRARWLHPVGDGFHASLDVPGGAGTGVPLLDTPATHPAIVRLSRALGTAPQWPDAFGLAFRLVDVHGPGAHQDVLVTTSVDVPVLHHLPLPAPRGPWRQSYSSLLAHRIGGDVRLIGAIPRPAERAFDLAVAPLLGRWRTVARLRLGDPLGDAETEGLQFDVWTTGGGIAPTGPLQGLRRPVYRGSRRGRAEAGARGA